MEIPKNITIIMNKQGINYDELRQILLNSLEVIEKDVWKVKIDKLIFPIQLNDEEVFEVLDFFFLYEYDTPVYVNLYYEPNAILVEAEKGFEWFMLALVVMLFVFTVFFMVMMHK